MSVLWLNCSIKTPQHFVLLQLFNDLLVVFLDANILLAVLAETSVKHQTSNKTAPDITEKALKETSRKRKLALRNSCQMSRLELYGCLFNSIRPSY